MVMISASSDSLGMPPMHMMRLKELVRWGAKRSVNVLKYSVQYLSGPGAL